MLHVSRRPGERIVQHLAHIDAGLDTLFQRLLIERATLTREAREVDAHADPRGVRRRLQSDRRHDCTPPLGGQERTLRHDAIRESRSHTGLRAQVPQCFPRRVTVVGFSQEQVMSTG